jgi:GT2 family glycosyltransferase
MRRSPKISLVVSLFSQAWCSDLVLSSISEQRGIEDFEVLFCDDGSSDNILPIISRWEVQTGIDARYIWQPHRNGRVSRSRNNAIRCSQGDVLVFLDGDTCLSQTFLQDHLQMHSSPKVLACGGRWHVSVDHTLDPRSLRNIVSEGLSHTDSFEFQQQKRWLTLDRPWMACIGGNFSVTAGKDILFDEAIEGWGSEDRDLACRLFAIGYHPVALPTVNTVHLDRPGMPLGPLTHDGIVTTLRNKLHLQRKYPAGEMDASLDVVRYFHFDSNSGNWQRGPYQPDLSPATILEQFERFEEATEQSQTPVRSA